MQDNYKKCKQGINNIDTHTHSKGTKYLHKSSQPKYLITTVVILTYVHKLLDTSLSSR